MEANPQHIIDLSEVTKTYKGRIHALRGITMRVRAGEVFGLLGPTGAGKSTLVKILMTVIRPSRCHGTMLGRAVGDKDALTDVGYLPEHHRFPEYLKGWQVLDFYGAMAGVLRRERKQRLGPLLETVGMSEWAATPIKRYSKGMKQRVGLAQALMNDPRLVLLDEPTDGVDPVGRREIRDICVRLKNEGRTVFINSHLLSELEMVCDRVAILVQGTLRSQGTIDELTEDQRHYRVELAHDPETARSHFQAALDASHADLAPEFEGPAVRLKTVDPAAIDPVVRSLLERGAMIRSIVPHRPSLEDLFMQAVTNERTGETTKLGASREKRAGKGAPA